ncbi:MAG: leucine--tRNA ligase [Saprospiraceae bacterium]|nr:leucine--tRNA ligase [Saprospiraceae bacterium]
MEYNPSQIESKWAKFWEQNQTYKVENGGSKPKFYILNMFPYPSGAGLHVGHPLGYIATDIFARYKRLKGFNVLNPMGYDSFGLPAEQYAIQTGTHPAVTTVKNINTFRSQLDKIGFSFDWSREVRTSDPAYYKWTQWIFMQLFNHYFDKDAQKALKVSDLVAHFEKEGNAKVNAVCDEDTPSVSAAEWNAMSEKEQQIFLLHYRLTMPEEAYVNWCPAMGSVLSNDEVKDGVSERGGYPVERKLMKQWAMRITAYADRLLEGLNNIDWSESLKEQQRNWIGRSQGASVKFDLALDPSVKIEVFTTRVDTIYGVTFMVLAPEHELVDSITTPEQREEIENYKKWTASRSEVDRMSEGKKVTGAFTGAYCINPFDGAKVPIYIADYVLAGYGTGAVMAVPSGDQRDWNFAKHFNLPIIPILDAQKDIETAADNTKEGRYINSGIINGMTYKEATQTLINWLEERGLGKGKVQYRLRNAVFSRQRYWGEPVPVYWKEGVPYLIDESELPLELPSIDEYLPTATGEPPLGRATDWKYKGEYEYELSTMPGWAGSSWYFYRYMDAQNDQEFASKAALDYWRQVDLYVGGTEHAVGHLLYSRFWNLFLYDLGLVPEKEYAKKLVNQGMIQGRSLFIHLKTGRSLHVQIQFADEKDRLFKDKYVAMTQIDNRFEGIDTEGDIAWQTDDAGKQFVVLTPEVEKMSKSKYNVVNPDDMIAQYGADCFRMYEMFLGPITDAKPWSTSGITGVAGFLRKFWSLMYDINGKFLVNDNEPTKDELKILHTCIKKVNDDIERFGFNTCVSAFMVCVNELKAAKCSKRAILNELTILLAPFAPFIAEEAWTILGNTPSVLNAAYPNANEAYLVSDAVVYPIAINGKTRGEISFPTGTAKDVIEAAVPDMEVVKKWVNGSGIKKIVVVPGRMINVVI